MLRTLDSAVSTPPGWRSLLGRWILPSPPSTRAGGMKRRMFPLTLGLGYISLVAVLGGLSFDHVLIGLLCGFDYYNHRTRHCLWYFLPFILTGVVFDSIRYYYWSGVEGHVHVAEPYLRDLRWFGIELGQGLIHTRVTPNEYFQLHYGVLADLICGFAYLFFVTESLLAAFYLYVKRYFVLLSGFAWSWFVVNVVGYLTYFIYPAAPPWYVSKYGLGPARMNVDCDPAAANRFDQILGTQLFSHMYERGIVPYGAYPSLHVTYPLLVVWVTFILPELKWLRMPAVAFYFLMCFSAVYLQHHYVVDILLGSVYASVIAAAATYILKDTLRTRTEGFTE